MKRILLALVLLLIPSISQAFDEINGNKIVLLTSLERRVFSDSSQYEDVTRQRAELACGLLGKQLIDFSWVEKSQENIFDECSKEQIKKWGCLTKKDIQHYKIPSKTSLLPVDPTDMETHYHRGRVTVAGVSLGFVPIIIQYKARIATDIKCGDINTQQFTTN